MLFSAEWCSLKIGYKTANCLLLSLERFEFVWTAWKQSKAKVQTQKWVTPFLGGMSLADINTKSKCTALLWLWPHYCWRGVKWTLFFLSLLKRATFVIHFDSKLMCDIRYETPKCLSCISFSTEKRMKIVNTALQLFPKWKLHETKRESNRPKITGAQLDEFVSYIEPFHSPTSL